MPVQQRGNGRTVAGVFAVAFATCLCEPHQEYFTVSLPMMDPCLLHSLKACSIQTISYHFRNHQSLIFEKKLYNGCIINYYRVGQKFSVP